MSKDYTKSSVRINERKRKPVKEVKKNASNNVIKIEVKDDKQFTFSTYNFEKAKNIISKYPEGKQKSATLPLLDIAQRQNGGWLSVSAIEYVATFVDEPYMRIYEVASFYSMFHLKPVGTFHIQVCGTTPCWLRGAADILIACENHIGIKCGASTKEGKFTISEVECLGACVNAPVVQINDDYYEDLTSDKIINVINKLNDIK